MSLHIHNTASGKKEEFVPLKKGFVSIYACGPTVYNNVHIGNLRSFFMYDIVRRVFEYENYTVTQVMNITDVDDKTIKRSTEQGLSLKEFTRHYETLFLADLHALNILTPHKLLRATEHIDDMISMISTLLEKEIAYTTTDGVYFSIKKFKDYGSLAGVHVSDEVQERIANDEYDKENPWDFALWKYADDVNTWKAPFGQGRPGWSIECSAMATSALGPTIDLHLGGTDLIFPHHTNEIAQSECATGKPFVKYWIHGAFVNVESGKMAKSKGNFLTLADIEAAGISPLAFRYWLLTAHYRSQVNFTLEALGGAQNAFIKLVETFIRLGEVEKGHEHVHATPEPRDYKAEFAHKVNDDFDMPGALALAWELIKDHTVTAQEKVTLLLDFDRVFGFGLKAVQDIKKEEKDTVPPDVIALAEAREDARHGKDWKKADALRQEIEARGYTVRDEAESYKLSKK